MWKFREDKVRPALHGGWFLAPTTEQRLEYTKLLCVWGKDKVSIPETLKEAFEVFNVCISSFMVTKIDRFSQKKLTSWANKDEIILRDEDGAFYDPFHPYFISEALQKYPEMKYHIFGLEPGDQPSSDRLSTLFQTFGNFQPTAKYSYS